MKSLMGFRKDFPFLLALTCLVMAEVAFGVLILWVAPLLPLELRIVSIFLFFLSLTALITFLGPLLDWLGSHWKWFPKRKQEPTETGASSMIGDPGDESEESK